MYLNQKFDSGFILSLSPFVTFKKFGILNLDWIRYFSLSVPCERVLHTRLYEGAPFLCAVIYFHLRFSM